MEKNRIRALDSLVNTKGMISMSSDSWIFSYKEKHQNYSLEMSVFVTTSNLSKFNYFFFFFFFGKNSYISSSSLTSLE